MPSLHTREVAGSSPAVPIEIPCKFVDLHEPIEGPAGRGGGLPAQGAIRGACELLLRSYIWSESQVSAGVLESRSVVASATSAPPGNGARGHHHPNLRPARCDTVCTGANMPVRPRMQDRPVRAPVSDGLLLHAWSGSSGD